jgi:hypothetical protein
MPGAPGRTDETDDVIDSSFLTRVFNQHGDYFVKASW